MNVLKLQAALLVLKLLVSDKRMHARLMLDNTTTVECTANMGTDDSAK